MSWFIVCAILRYVHVWFVIRPRPFTQLHFRRTLSSSCIIMFQCRQCNKSYQRKPHLLRHEATRKFHPSCFHISSDFPLDTLQLSSSCPFCNKSFQKPYVHYIHIRNEILVNNPTEKWLEGTVKLVQRRIINRCLQLLSQAGNDSPVICASLPRHHAIEAHHAPAVVLLDANVVSQGRMISLLSLLALQLSHCHHLWTHHELLWQAVPHFSFFNILRIHLSKKTG